MGPNFDIKLQKVDHRTSSTYEHEVKFYIIYRSIEVKQTMPRPNQY